MCSVGREGGDVRASAHRQAPGSCEISVFAPAGPAKAFVLVLPGGKQRDHRPLSRYALAALRMRPFVHSIRRRVPDSAVALVRYRHRGWNDADPVDDVGFAYRTMRERYGPLPGILVGHSMGGRAALRAAGLPDVRGVVALAPWIPNGEPVAQLAGRTVVLLHGSRDLRTSPDATARFAVQARVLTDHVLALGILRSGHTMLSRASLWHRLTAQLVAAILSGSPVGDVGTTEPGVQEL
jgi:pimeloyl-ACP methyl ester carboxylesterase